MGKNNASFSRQPENEDKAAKSRGFALSTHFKKTLEAGNAIRHMKLKRAKSFLQNVILQKEAVPFRNRNGGAGRHAQAKPWHTAQCGWPKKASEFLLGLLANAEANAVKKSLDLDALVITHIQVNQAPKQRRRTYRAHGRIGPYQNSPCHIELILEEEEGAVARPEKEAAGKKKVSKKKLRREAADAAPGLDMD